MIAQSAVVPRRDWSAKQRKSVTDSHPHSAQGRQATGLAAGTTKLDNVLDPSFSWLLLWSLSHMPIECTLIIETSFESYVIQRKFRYLLIESSEWVYNNKYVSTHCTDWVNIVNVFLWLLILYYSIFIYDYKWIQFHTTFPYIKNAQ